MRSFLYEDKVPCGHREGMFTLCPLKHPQIALPVTRRRWAKLSDAQRTLWFIDEVSAALLIPLPGSHSSSLASRLAPRPLNPAAPRPPVPGGGAVAAAAARAPRHEAADRQMVHGRAADGGVALGCSVHRAGQPANGIL